MSVFHSRPASAPGASLVSGRTPANLRRWQSALAKLRAGTYRPRIVFVGDSKTVGAGAGTSSADTWTSAAEPRSKVAHVARLLNARGVAASRNSFMASSGLPSVAAKQAYDPRLSGMSGWSGGSQTLGGVMWATSGTNSLTFTPEGSVDRAELYYQFHAGDGSMTVTVDADTAVLATMDGSGGGETIGKAVIAFARASHAINVQRTSGGFASLLGIVAQDSTMSAVDVIQAGAFGTGSGFHSSASGPWAASNALAALAPDLVIVQLGTNDLNAALPVAAFTANIRDILNKAKAAGANVVLEVPTVGATGSYGTEADREAYREALMFLGAANGCMVVDHAARFGSYASANALGLFRDTIHETEAGYADEAAVLIDALLF